jgi:hypothetical protein
MGGPEIDGDLRVRPSIDGALALNHFNPLTLGGQKMWRQCSRNGGMQNGARPE